MRLTQFWEDFEILLGTFQELEIKLEHNHKTTSWNTVDQYQDFRNNNLRTWPSIFLSKPLTEASNIFPSGQRKFYFKISVTLLFFVLFTGEKDFKDLRHHPLFLSLFLSPWKTFLLAKMYLFSLSFRLLQITSWDLTTPNPVYCLKILEPLLPQHYSEIKNANFFQSACKKKLWHKREPVVLNLIPRAFSLAWGQGEKPRKRSWERGWTILTLSCPSTVKLKAKNSWQPTSAIFYDGYWKTSNFAGNNPLTKEQGTQFFFGWYLMVKWDFETRTVY